jgi:D-tyrosyl-tRNA(Tyr) deacylase
MRALVQRVSWASVHVDDEEVGAIGPGLCAFVGVTHDDDEARARRLAEKLWHLRLFDDELSVAQTTRAVLVVSQFTLYGDASRGRRPSWIAAARPEQAEPLVDAVAGALRDLGAEVATGRFRTHMRVRLENDGPITLQLDV